MKGILIGCFPIYPASDTQIVIPCYFITKSSVISRQIHEYSNFYAANTEFTRFIFCQMPDTKREKAITTPLGKGTHYEINQTQSIYAAARTSAASDPSRAG